MIQNIVRNVLDKVRGEKKQNFLEGEEFKELSNRLYDLPIEIPSYLKTSEERVMYRLSYAVSRAASHGKVLEQVNQLWKRIEELDHIKMELEGTIKEQASKIERDKSRLKGRLEVIQHKDKVITELRGYIEELEIIAKQPPGEEVSSTNIPKAAESEAIRISPKIEIKTFGQEAGESIGRALSSVLAEGLMNPSEEIKVPQVGQYYTKCLKCNYVVPTKSQFDEECRKGEWFNGEDGNTLDYEHDCSKKDISDPKWIY